jgi:hypothetical protein
VLRYSVNSREGPFEKVKGLISEMLDKLQAEAGAEATEKAFCDEETAKTTASKSDLEATMSKLTTKIDANAAKSKSLKADVKELMDELSKLAKDEAEMIKVREDAMADFHKAKEDYTEGLAGVRHALVVLRDYYAAKEPEAAAFLQGKFSSFAQQPAKPETFSKASDSGVNIIGILEVVESDFATNLAKAEETEATEADEHAKMLQANKITKTTKDQDVKYKLQEAAALDKENGELTSDLDTTSTEHGAVTEYLDKLNDRCIAKPETYETRKQRREAEIAGLKEAMSILEEVAFVQRKTQRHQKRRFSMRGSLRVGA